MQHPDPAPTPAQPEPLATGQTLSRAFAAGDELFCAAGTLQLNTSAVAGIEALPGLQLRLHAGQSWRAPAALWVQATAVDGAARLRCSTAAAQEAALPALPTVNSGWRARLLAALGGGRTQRA